MTETVWNGADGDGDRTKPVAAAFVRVSDQLLSLVPAVGTPRVRVGDLVTGLRDRAYGLVLLLFALPNCLPIPPGVSALFGLPLLLFGLQMAIGQDRPWLPRSLAERSLDRGNLHGILARAAGYVRRVETLVRPRFGAMTGRRSERLIGLAVVAFAISIAVPMPFSNFLPSLGIAVLALGMLAKDGIAVLVGLLIGAKGVAITTTILLFAGVLTNGLLT